MARALSIYAGPLLALLLTSLAPQQGSGALETAQAQEPSLQEQAVRAVAKASNDFARDLYKVVRNEPGNLVVSPLSAAAVLALAWLGSAKRTAQQLSNALHLPQDYQQVIYGYRGLFNSLQSQDAGLRLRAASRVFVRRGLGLREDFRHAADEAFLAGAQEVDFAQPAEAAAVVNAWVRDKTHGEINELVQPGALSSGTALLLANAVYFKGAWRTQFEPSRTAPKPFRTAPGAGAGAGGRNVSLMSTTGDFPYARLPDLGAQALRLPYRGEHVSMLLLLPDTVDGLQQLERAMDSLDVSTILAKMQTDEVYVWLPRFSLRTSLVLNDALVQLGLSDLFGSSADFSGIATNGALLSSVLQRATIEVNEEGTEAAAATGGIFLLSAGLYNFFRADHPFMFFLLDDRTGAVLFQGRFVEPE